MRQRTKAEVDEDGEIGERIINSLPDDPQRALSIMAGVFAAVSNGCGADLETMIKAVRIHSDAMLAEEAADQSEHRHAH